MSEWNDPPATPTQPGVYRVNVPGHGNAYAYWTGGHFGRPAAIQIIAEQLMHTAGKHYPWQAIVRGGK